VGKNWEGWCNVYSQLNCFYFWAFYVCASFGENPSRNASVRVHAEDTQTDTRAEANWFYNLSHAICYSYGTDNNRLLTFLVQWVYPGC